MARPNMTASRLPCALCLTRAAALLAAAAPLLPWRAASQDRRPASNLDPYVVTKLLVETTLLM